MNLRPRQPRNLTRLALILAGGAALIALFFLRAGEKVSPTSGPSVGDSSATKRESGKKLTALSKSKPDQVNPKPAVAPRAAKALTNAQPAIAKPAVAQPVVARAPKVAVADPAQIRFIGNPAPAPAPAVAAVAKPKFDPRFEQPATKMKLFGISEEEAQGLAAEMRLESEAAKEKAWAWARKNGKPVKGKTADGGSFELMRLDEDGRPIYNQTLNAQARISHNVHKVNHLDNFAGDYSLSGLGWTVGMWEQGPPRLSHRDFSKFLDGTGGQRVTYEDRNPADPDEDISDEYDSHATHVLGTMIGNGVAPLTSSAGDDRTRGMAWAANAKAYNWTNDTGEMLLAGASAPNQSSRLTVSNHSYGTPGGWEVEGSGWIWRGPADFTEDGRFSRYNFASRAVDRVGRQTPYLLSFWSAGNSRDNNPSFLDSVTWGTNSGTWGLNASGAPDGDGVMNGGYDTLNPGKNISKNGMTVGAVTAAEDDGERDLSEVEMSSFSSWGPADDGRIKPDIVACGVGVLSAEEGSDFARGTKGGTSMASPGAAGTAILLQEHYNNRTGQTMRASTLKALMIHTADDVLDLGPDYKSGWGLINAEKAVEQIDLHWNNPGGRHLVEDYLSTDRPQIRFTFKGTGSPIKASLVWTDPEGSSQIGLDDRTKTLVNDLDMEIRVFNSSAGYLGSFMAPQLDPLNPSSLPTYNGNDTDNVEQLGNVGMAITGFVDHTYELVITHKGILQQPGNLDPNKYQAFSLILEGNAAADTGNVADAVDTPERFFSTPAADEGGFVWKSGSFYGGDRAESVMIDHNETSAFETEVTGPITVSFDWSVSSESGFDYLRFYSNGVLQEQISGEVATTNVTRNLPAGTHTLRWAYEKDVSVDTGSDKGTIDRLVFNSLPEALDNTDFIFSPSTNGLSPWFLTNTDPAINPGIPTGDYATSGNVAPFTASSMSTIIEGPALVQFTMVQSGSDGVLTANVGGQQIQHGTGNILRRYSIQLEPGPQTIFWIWVPTAATGHVGIVDELTVTPIEGSVEQASNVEEISGRNSGAVLVLEDPFLAAWVPDSTGGAPSGVGGTNDGTAIRTVFSDPDRFVNAINGTALTTSLQGPGLVSFWWQATGSPDGLLHLEKRHAATDPFTDASPAAQGPRKLEPISGGTGWQQVFLEIPPGLTELRWVYDSAADQSEGAAWIDQIVVQDDLLHPARGLDRWGTAWQTEGDAPWSGSYDASNEGIDSTSHGDLINNESATISASVVGPKKLFFHWKVSSQANSDFLSFTMNGIEVVPAISGEVDWQPVVIDVPPGNQILRWTYAKDAGLSAGMDRGWIDSVALLRPDFGIESITRMDDTFDVVTIRKDPTPGFFLETSTDLKNWTSSGSGSGPNGRNMLLPSLEDSAVITASPGQRSFYRLTFEPESVQEIANASFEQPGGIPGWGPDDGPGNSSLAFSPSSGAADGGVALYLLEGFSQETDAAFSTYLNSTISLTTSVGHVAGFTGSSNLSSIVLKSTIAGEAGRIDLNAFNAVPQGEWRDFHVTLDDFFANFNPDAFFSYKVRLEGANTASWFDHVRVVSEPH